jgi:cell wall-associated NlpC family hydrolase
MHAQEDIVNTPRSRRAMIGDVAYLAAALAIPSPLLRHAGSRVLGFGTPADLDPDLARFDGWTAELRTAQLTDRSIPLGIASARVAALAVGTPYEAHLLDAYLRRGDAPPTEPLILSLTHFDCNSFVESCVAVARAARVGGSPTWKGFGREVERMRYRNGLRGDYTTRLHYFSEWVADGDTRSLVRDVGFALGGVEDRRPLRFMTEHRDSYVALANDRVFASVKEMEKRLDPVSRHVIPTARIAEVEDRIQNGDVIGFATNTPGLDVTHCAIAVRDKRGVLRVVYPPLNGGAVEVSRNSLPEYVAQLRDATGIMVARPI